MSATEKRLTVFLALFIAGVVLYVLANAGL